MYTQHNITSERFTVRLRTVASYLGYKKIGGLEKLLRQMHPNNRISYGINHVRVSQLLNEIDRYKKGEQ